MIIAELQAETLTQKHRRCCKSNAHMQKSIRHRSGLLKIGKHLPIVVASIAEHPGTAKLQLRIPHRDSPRGKMIGEMENGNAREIARDNRCRRHPCSGA